jgi:hypothetical protein
MMVGPADRYAAEGGGRTPNFGLALLVAEATKRETNDDGPGKDDEDRSENAPDIRTFGIATETETARSQRRSPRCSVVGAVHGVKMHVCWSSDAEKSNDSKRVWACKIGCKRDNRSVKCL